jgi:fermentation-respiration switch protein FrsA (DUF1100 family)
VAYAVGFNTCCHDDRVDAVMVEGLINDFPLDGDYAADLKGTPVMFMHGDADPTPIADIHAAFDAAEPPKYLLSIPGGDHSNAYRSGPSERQVATTGLAFFDLHLKDRAEALNTLQAAQGVEAIP